MRAHKALILQEARIPVALVEVAHPAAATKIGRTGASPVQQL